MPLTMDTAGDRSAEIVVGIDFGTTHSGVSWAVNGGKKTIRLIDNWPDPQFGTASPQKVPSYIAYDENGRPQKWGYAVSDRDEAFRWIKILLEDDNNYINESEEVKTTNSMLNRRNKRAQDVVTDYLRALWQYTMDDIYSVRDDYDKDTFSMRVILTVPAMWSPIAQERTKQAAENAGITCPIELVTEPEAAALATLRDKSEENTLKVGDAFVLCDAGGGTVDLISYKVNALHPLSIEECAIGEGELCGSVYLDLAFQRLIITLIGEQQWNKTKPIHKRRMMKDWETGIKRCFSGNPDERFAIELQGIEDDPLHHIIDNTITLNNAKLRAVFDHVFLKIQNLIARQIAQVRSRNHEVKAILLVGGFGQNKYLFDRLRQCHSSSGIHVARINGAWSAICRGATMWGMEHSPHSTSLISPQPTVGSRLARYSYGCCFSTTFDPSRHLVSDRYWDDIECNHKARNQMVWLLRKGEPIKEGTILRHKYYTISDVGRWETSEKHFSERLYYCRDNFPPLRKTTTVYELCNVNFKMSASKIRNESSFKSEYHSGKKFRRVHFDVAIALGNANLGFSVSYKGSSVGQVDAAYEENP